VDAIVNWQSNFDLSREEERAVKMGFRFVDRENERYPGVLKEIHDTL